VLLLMLHEMGDYDLSTAIEAVRELDLLDLAVP